VPGGANAAPKSSARGGVLVRTEEDGLTDVPARWAASTLGLVRRRACCTDLVGACCTDLVGWRWRVVRPALGVARCAWHLAPRPGADATQAAVQGGPRRTDRLRRDRGPLDRRRDGSAAEASIASTYKQSWLGVWACPGRGSRSALVRTAQTGYVALGVPAPQQGVCDLP